MIEVFDRPGWSLSREDPEQFACLLDFNTVLDAEGRPDDWIESELLAGLDNSAARALRQIDALPRPAGLARQAASKGWHSTHIMSPMWTTSLALWVAAQAVRTSTFRDAVNWSTARDMQEFITTHYEAKLANATDSAEREHLRYMAGIRVVGTQPDQNALPHLMAHLAVRLGEILYREYVWAVQRMSMPSLVLGDDPVMLLNILDDERCGSYSQVVTRGARPVSLSLEWKETVERALAAMRGNHLILMPLGPQHLLTLSCSTLMKPGRHDMPADAASSYNAMTAIASRRWICMTPGDAAREPSPPAVAYAAEIRRAAMRASVRREPRAAA